MTSFDLSGTVAIVTGGNGGIGRGIAMGLADAGADVVIAARNEQKTADVVREVEALGRRAIGVRCDVNMTADIEATVGAALEAFGKVTILVNNAGVAAAGLPEQLTESDWDVVLNTNLKSMFRFSQAVHPHMVAAGGGKIISIASEYALFGGAIVSSYAASKAGILGLTRALAVAWAASNIQVNAIIPGWIATDMTEYARSIPLFNDVVLQRTPAGRYGNPEDLAGTAVFLASRASDFVTGQAIAVDGGFSISQP